MVCSCDDISTPSKRETVVSQLNVSESSKTEKEYYLKQGVSIIEVTLITRMYYGPPGYNVLEILKFKELYSQL